MAKINLIQQKIKELNGGDFQKLADSYLNKKYKFSNICPLGSEDGTNKPTKGTPDSYVILPNNKYIAIMYGSVKNNPYKKLKEDIEDCLNPQKLNIERDRIEKIICVCSSSNISIKQHEELNALTGNIELEIINLGTLSYDLLYKYPAICNDFLNVSIDSNQIFTIDNFIENYNKRSIASPLNTLFLFREKEIEELTKSIEYNDATIIMGIPGVGKTKLGLETCKLFEKRGYKIFCVKSNSMSVQSDLNMYFDEPGNYILFLDDINEIKELEYILSFIYSRNKDIKIKIVATVRDYAKENILSTLLKYNEPNVIRIENFSNEQIKQFLQKLYKINNLKYLEQICEISRGNIRYAVMAGQKAINEGLTAITNVEQLFNAYYSNVLEDISDKNDNKIICNILFIIAFLGKTDYKLNECSKVLLNYFNIEENDFTEICDKLYFKEIIDKYENTIFNINDQNFKDFIIYYVLIEKEYISVEKLLSLTFPKYCSKIIDAINLIFKIFLSKKSFNYIHNSVNKVWQNCNVDDEYYFVKYFAVLNPNKSLLFV